jgi:ribosome maturation factor RimP
VLWFGLCESGLRPTFLFDFVNGAARETGRGESVKDSRPIVDRISEAVSPILWTLGLELVDVVCVGQGPRSVVRVFIDKSDGVTLDDCERAHKALGPALDVADPIPHAYTLEVSSPGLDRPFKRIQDYRRAVGKRVSLKLREPLAGQWRLEGTLADVADDTVTLELNDPPPLRTVTLEQRLIAAAKRAVKW